MIFTASCDQLATVISRAAQGLPPHPLQDIYGMIRLETDLDAGMILMTAGDGDVTVTASVSCLPQAYGSCVVRGRVLAEMSKYFAGSSATFEYGEKRLEIAAGKSRFTLPAGSGDAYPEWAQSPPATLRLDGEQFASAVRRVVPAASGTAPVLTAIRLEPGDGVLILVATDVARMAYASVPFQVTGAVHLGLPLGPIVPLPPPSGAALLPSKAAQRFARDLEGMVYMGWNDALIGLKLVAGDLSATEMVSRQIAGKYLPWRKVMSAEPGEFPVTGIDVKDLARALRMAQLAAGEGGRAELAFTADGLTVSAGDEGQECSEHVDMEYQGEDVTFLLGAQDVLDGLSGCGAVASMAFASSPARVFLRGEGSYRWMLAPRREL
jgi:DNA polymerase-3 subunit beta